jgi:hypothetical protein
MCSGHQPHKHDNTSLEPCMPLQDYPIVIRPKGCKLVVQLMRSSQLRCRGPLPKVDTIDASLDDRQWGVGGAALMHDPEKLAEPHDEDKSRELPHNNLSSACDRPRDFTTNLKTCQLSHARPASLLLPLGKWRSIPSFQLLCCGFSQRGQ